ncbi:MAG TPA: hypothetical protein VGC45_00640 [Gryllotalpicola sp.]
MTADAVTIRAVVVDDQAMVRVGLATMIDAATDLATVGMTANGAEALTGTPGELLPDVALLAEQEAKLAAYQNAGLTAAVDKFSANVNVSTKALGQ